MTEKEVILQMRKMEEWEAKLVYDASTHRDYGEGKAYGMPGIGHVSKSLVDHLLDEGLIYYGDVIQWGSVQLYELTELGKNKIYE